jgi:clan AA aspartic protease (TIGR02281 family)
MRSDRISIGIGVVALLTLPACADLLHKKDASPPPPVRSALHYVNGIALVAVHAPNDHTAWFALDTGAGNFTFIDPKYGKTLGLKFDIVRDPAIPFINLSAPIEFLEVDGFGRRDVTVFVNEISERAAFADLDVKVQGVLGTGFFKGQCLHLDWAKGEFTPNELRQRRARHVAVPLRYGTSGELYCTVKIDGSACEALVDTASPQTLLTKEFADQFGIKVDKRGPVVHIETSLGPAAVADGVVDVLTLGTEEVKDLPVGVVDRRMPHANLLIGTDVLSRFGVILDLADAPYLVLDPLEGAARPEGTVPPPDQVEPPKGDAEPMKSDAEPPKGDAPKTKSDDHADGDSKPKDH